MMPPTSIDGTDITGATIDGTDVQEITVDGQTVFTAAPDIPDSQNLQAHYDLQEQPESDSQTIDPLIDQSGNEYDASAIGSPTMDLDGFNNLPTAVLDGISDGWEVTQSNWVTLTQPVTAYAVFALDAAQADLDQRYVIFDFAETFSDDRMLINWSESGPWEIFAGTSTIGSVDQTINVLTGLYDGSNSVIEEDGSQTGSGDVGGESLEALPIGHRFAEGSRDRFWEGRLCELAIYDAAHGSTTRTDWYNYAETRWNL